jgi:hypothetical protein
VVERLARDVKRSNEILMVGGEGEEGSLQYLNRVRGVRGSEAQARI